MQNRIHCPFWLRQNGHGVFSVGLCRIGTLQNLVSSNPGSPNHGLAKYGFRQIKVLANRCFPKHGFFPILISPNLVFTKLVSQNPGFPNRGFTEPGFANSWFCLILVSAKPDFIKAVQHASEIKENYYTVLSEKNSIEKTIDFIETDELMRRMVK
jgi:hypothetical protein